MITMKNALIAVCLLLIQTVAYANDPQARISPVSLSEINAKSMFAEHGAEVIKKSIHIDVDENYHEVSTHYIAIKINDSHAINDYSQVTIRYDSFYEDNQLMFANVIDQDGNRQALDPNALQVQTPPSPYFFQDTRNIVFSVPSLKSGTVIEYQYQTKTTQLRIPDYWSSRYFFYFWQSVLDARSYRIDPVRYSEYVVSIPEKLSAKLRHNNGSKKFKTKSKTKNGITTYHFSAKNLEPIELQDGMPAIQEFLPYISLSTLDDWSHIKKWAGTLFENERIKTNEVNLITDKIKLDYNTEQGRIKGVYEYLNNNIRYIYSHVGRGGYTPHRPDEILKQGFGDCKDQTMLAVVLLNELGIEAHPALVNTQQANRFTPERYNPSFDHMLVYMPNQPVGNKWMDTTGDKALFTGSPSYMSERHALILSPDPDITFIQGAKQSEIINALDLGIEVIELKGQTLIGRLTVEPKGSFESYYRSVVKQSSESDRRSFFTSLMTVIFPSSEVDSITINNDDNLFEPINITLDFNIKDVWAKAPQPLRYSFSYQQIWRQLFLKDGLLKDHERKVPLYLVADYGFNMTFKTSSPEQNYYFKSITASLDVENDYFTVTNQSDSTEISSQIVVRGQFNRHWVGLNIYEDYFQTYNDWLKSSYWSFSYNQNTSRSKESALLLKAEESITATNQLIQLHLDEGQFEEALATASKAIERADVTGHTYHLLGLSQAYNNDANASEASFQKAEELGYE